MNDCSNALLLFGVLFVCVRNDSHETKRRLFRVIRIGKYRRLPHKYIINCPRVCVKRPTIGWLIYARALLMTLIIIVFTLATEGECKGSAFGSVCLFVCVTQKLLLQLTLFFDSRRIVPCYPCPWIDPHLRSGSGVGIRPQEFIKAFFTIVIHMRPI